MNKDVLSQKWNTVPSTEYDYEQSILNNELTSHNLGQKNCSKTLPYKISTQNYFCVEGQQSFKIQ